MTTHTTLGFNFEYNSDKLGPQEYFESDPTKAAAWQNACVLHAGWVESNPTANPVDYIGPSTTMFQEWIDYAGAKVV
jgi:hypothetical protein